MTGRDYLRRVAIDAATAELLTHEWAPGHPKSAHSDHQYHHNCAVCASDLTRIVPVALDAADAALSAITNRIDTP